MRAHPFFAAGPEPRTAEDLTPVHVAVLEALRHTSTQWPLNAEELFYDLPSDIMRDTGRSLLGRLLGAFWSRRRALAAVARATAELIQVDLVVREQRSYLRRVQPVYWITDAGLAAITPEASDG